MDAGSGNRARHQWRRIFATDVLDFHEIMILLPEAIN